MEELNSVEEILDYILNVYAINRPDRDSELGSMGVYEELEQIAKAMDIRATFVKVVM